MKSKLNLNYSKLLGRIRECGFTQKTLAEAIGISSSTLSVKVNNNGAFTTTEMADICRLLDISKHEIGEYFFTERV